MTSMAEEIDLFKTPTEPSFFIGQVQSEIFTSPDSFFKVLIVSVEEANFDWHEPEITVTGSFGHYAKSSQCSRTDK